MEFLIYDIVKSGRKAEPLMCVSATVIAEKATFWLIEARGHSYGGFRNRTKVPRDGYARSIEGAWRQFAEWEQRKAAMLRAEANTSDGYSALARQQIAALTAHSEAVSA